jgi:hypothetical protein
MPMQASYEITTERMTYRVAEQTLLVEARDSWAAQVIEELFAGWYLTRETGMHSASPSPGIVIQNSVTPPNIPREWTQFEIAGSGTCFTDGHNSYIDIEGSVVAIGQPGQPIEIWMNGPLRVDSPALTRVVTYALSAALRHRGLFELHSGAVTHPTSGHGVLIIGPSGSGKSTLTVHLAAAGWPFLTDDVLLLEPADGLINAWPLRRCFAITSETFEASSFLQGRDSLSYLRAEHPNAKRDKKRLVPHDVFDSQFQQKTVPRTLLFSEITGDDRSQVLPLSPAEAMARLIRMSPWSCYDRTTAPDHLSVLSALVKQSTAYSLLAGKDLLDQEIAANLVAGCMRAS